MNILIKELENLKKFKEYVSDINKKISPIVLSGLSSVGKIQLLEATKEFADRNICIVTYNELQAKKIYKDLKKRGMTFIGSIIIYSYLQAIGIIYSHDKGCYLHRENTN